jgi:hydrogenase maturation protease
MSVELAIDRRWALIAGIGNIFLGDDAFGVEVVRRLRTQPIPAGVAVLDVGIRALHFAYELLDPLELLIIVDAVARGSAPGTIYLIEPELHALPEAAGDAHSMDLLSVFQTVRTMGGSLPRTLLVGCEPEMLGESLTLTPSIAAAVDRTTILIRELVARESLRRPERLGKETAI